MVKHALNWFEIPVVDFDRAKKFYGTIFDYDMPEMMMGKNRMGFLLHERGNSVGGTIILEAGRKPSDQGTLVYLNGGSDLSVVLDRVKAAGGSVVGAKCEVAPGMGYIALFKDTEGNLVGIHSMG